MTPAICGATAFELEATETRQEQIATNFVIQSRVTDMYEACHWIVSVEDYKYRDDTGAYIELQLEKLENAVAYIYHGTDRHNATTFIENN